MSNHEQSNSIEIEKANRLKNLSASREQRAKQILEMGDPVAVDEFTYLVPSQFDSNKKYQVTHIDSYSCNCKDFEVRCRGKNIFCKHIKAILLFEKIKAKYEVKPEVTQEIEFIIDTPQKDLCISCGSEDLIKSGKRKTTTGERQRYECKKCHKRFVLSPIPKIKGNEKIICLAMDCYYKGLSYRDIADQFQQFYGLKLHHETIRRWVLKFSRVMEKYSKTLSPKTSGIWNADETLILTKRGKNKKQPNANYDYLWNVLDHDTKFLLASVNSGRSRSTKDAQRVFKEAWNQNKKMPNQIITDKLKSYQSATLKTFRNWGAERKIKHTSIMGQRKVVNNNAIESHHSTQKEFQKVRRGVKNVQDYADGFKIYHNFIRKDVKNKTTPAEKCGIGLNGNRWNTLLLRSLENGKN